MKYRPLLYHITAAGPTGMQSTLPVLSGAAVGGLFAALHRFCNRRLWAAPRQPISVVITGGSRGLGKALAREFLAAGDRVLLTSRTQAAGEAAVRELREEVAAMGGSCPQVRCTAAAAAAA
jgi:chlorophyll(ide) b reductase